MTKPTHLLEKHTLADVFLVVYVLVDDYLKAGICAGRFVLPESKQQKGSYAELMTIGIVGDWMKQRYAGDWYVLVKQEYDDTLIASYSSIAHSGRICLPDKILRGRSYG